MPEALALVKRELGNEAVILGTRHLGGGLSAIAGGAKVEITAAPGDSHSVAAKAAIARRSMPMRDAGAAVRAPSPRPPAAQSAPAPRRDEPPAMPAELLSYYQQLIASEVSQQLAATFAREAATQPDVSLVDGIAAQRQALRTSIARRIPPVSGIDLSAGRSRRVVLIGPPGGGKTTTLAKLAAHFALRQQKQVALLSLDMHRLATHDQVRRYAELIGVPVFTAQTVTAVREILRTMPQVDLLLIDTHGVSPRDRGRFARLAALLRAVRPDETHLVLPASLARSAQDAMIRTFAPLGVSRVAITKLDEAIGFGVVLEALERLNWGVSYISDGQRVPSDLHEDAAERLAEQLLPAR